MMNIHEVVRNDKQYIDRDGFLFTANTFPANVYDAIIIKVPRTAPCECPQFPNPARSLEEHINLINELQIEAAYIIAEDIQFITKCPSLKYVTIVPADSCGDDFDYSPLYEMPLLKKASCCTRYGKKFEFKTTVDYSRIKGIEVIFVGPDGNEKNYRDVLTTKGIKASGYKDKDIAELFRSELVDTLMLIQCKARSLEGIQRSKKMQCLYLYHNRSLEDISALRHCKDTLRALRIDCCPKIQDFSVLGSLENLELLELSGSNKLPNLDFLKKMKKLSTFILTFEVEDGNLSNCLDLDYVYVKNRKFYNLKDKDLPKNGEKYSRGNDTIELWRRHE